MKKNKKPVKRNSVKKNNQLRGNKTSATIFDCTDGCKLYPKGCSDCRVNERNGN